MCDIHANTIAKLSRSCLTDYVGQLLFTEAGEWPFGNDDGKLFIVKWDSTREEFTKFEVPYLHSDSVEGTLEHVTFAPLSLSALPP